MLAVPFVNPAYLRKDGTVELTADWDAGNHKITAQELACDTSLIGSTWRVKEDGNDLIFQKDTGGGVWVDAFRIAGS